MQRLRSLVGCLLTLLLVGCTNPVPAEKSDYVGHWSGSTVSLVITQEGSVSYKRVEGSFSKSIDAPLKRFEGANFVVGLGPLSTTFVVSAIPHPEEGVWKMTVDGVELTRQGPARDLPGGEPVRF